MKKSSKILGSVALSAALVMGTAVPAFAAEPGANSDMVTVDDETYETGGQLKLEPTDSEDPDNYSERSVQLGTNSKESGASTIVTVSTYTSQLNVTVPLYLPVWFDTAGSINGADVITPSDNAYYIQNASPVDIKVKSVDYSNESGELKIAESITATDKDLYNLTITPTTATNTGDNYATANAATPFTMNDDDANGDDGATQNLNWVIAAKPATEGAEAVKQGFAVTGENAPLSKTLSDAYLAKITYTVGIASTDDIDAPTTRGAALPDPEAEELELPTLTVTAGTTTVKDLKDQLRTAGFTGAVTVKSGAADSTVCYAFKGYTLVNGQAPTAGAKYLSTSTIEIDVAS